MSELLCRGWNVAVPEVDVGDDVFVVHDADGAFSRVLVKARNAQERAYGYSAQFPVPRAQLLTPVKPELTYVFAARHEARWDAFIVIDRVDLAAQHRRHGLGSGRGDVLQFYFTFRPERVTCGDLDVTAYRNAWTARQLVGP